MSRKGDGVYSQFYDPHLNGTFAANPAQDQMALTRMMYTRHLTELCVNRFEWKGLPESVDPRFLELNLFWRALTVFFKYGKAGEFMALQAAGTGMPNAQDVPTHFQVTAPNILINEKLESGVDCVPIWANYLRVPELDKVNLYAMKLAALDRTIEINADNMRGTRIIAVPENQRLSATNLVQQMAMGQPAIMVTKPASEIMEAVQVFDLSGPSGQLTELWDAKSHLWNECMTMLGINNSNQDKKERLVAAEVSANDEQVDSTRFIALNARQYAAEQINELWPELEGKVSVDFRSTPEPVLENGEITDGEKENTPELKVAS